MHNVVTAKISRKKSQNSSGYLVVVKPSGLFLIFSMLIVSALTNTWKAAIIGVMTPH